MIADVIRPRLLASFAVLSLLTMPLTAIWFLLLAEIVFVVTGVAAVVQGRTPAGDRALACGFSVGLGLLAGPAVYLALAVVS
jgi:hypothetical protein